jgi:chromosomal replication initiation ATPase DnaA
LQAEHCFYHITSRGDDRKKIYASGPNDVAFMYYKTSEELYASKKNPIFAKKTAICLAKRLTYLTNAEIGARFGITYSAVSNAAGYVERSMGQDKDVNREITEIVSHFKG